MNAVTKANSIDSKFWDILKGIGIVLVVFGHFCRPLISYIYAFHLPLFFFISGYMYNEEKYGDNPYLNVAARMKSSWMKYVFLFWILIWMHNFFLENNMLWIYGDVYSFSDIIMKMTEALFGMGKESFGITLWYVPAAVIATCILGFIVTFSRKVEKICKNTFFKYIVQGAIIIACALAGYHLLENEVEVQASVQVSLTVMPFLWAGYLIRTFKNDFKKYLNVIVAVICAIAIFVVSREYRLDLAMMRVYPMMHLFAFLGIYLSMYVAKVIQKIPKIDTLFVTYGKASFWIMFAHLVFARLFDWTYIHLFRIEEYKELYLVIRTACFAKDFWPIYVFLGLGIAPLMHVVFKRFFIDKRNRR